MIDRQTEGRRRREKRGGSVAADCALSTTLSAPISQIVFHTARFFILRRGYFYFLHFPFVLFFISFFEFCLLQEREKLSQSEIIFGNCRYVLQVLVKAGSEGWRQRQAAVCEDCDLISVSVSQFYAFICSACVVVVLVFFLVAAAISVHDVNSARYVHICMCVHIKIHIHT